MWNDLRYAKSNAALPGYRKVTSPFRWYNVLHVAVRCHSKEVTTGYEQNLLTPVR